MSVELVPHPTPGPLVEATATVTVFGAGRSGIAAAELLLDRGYRVRLTDSTSSAELEKNCRPLAARGATISLGEQTAAFAAGSDFIVLSPGIDERGELFASPELDGVPVFGEIEIAYWYSPLPILAVTGTNGKSTTVSLLGLMLAEAGIKNTLAGNIGLALCNAVRNLKDEAVLVAEISSFQLHTTESFHPRMAVLLNLSPDHLERYDTLEHYYRMKFRIFERMGGGDLAVLNAGDREIGARAELAGEVPAARFSLSRHTGSLAFVEDGAVRLRAPEGGSVEVVSLDCIRLRGTHNLENVLAATAAAAACGADEASIGRAITGFGGLPHRLEPVDDLDGIAYFNDSKATTVDSVLRAVQSFPGPLVLIMGGRHKGSSFAPLAGELGSKARAVIAIGEAAGIIGRDLGDAVAVTGAGSLEDALIKARKQAEAGDVVLLSPGCSSFDMFASYEERGDEFKRIVTEMARHGR
ncbi:MAG: UDP-N-acetylmuramoyl-L-alanine--D-glutamate ligase [Candidatus Glassbacteria bacterium]|nr:UDP-N-acetylmuramoyl-L-alanine--D-glutamate ligase [Candidatus Glassbacteria bacterium]